MLTTVHETFSDPLHAGRFSLEALQWQCSARSTMRPQRYLPPSVVMDEDAPESWIFLDYGLDGRVLVLAPEQYEAIYRPAPEDQG